MRRIYVFSVGGKQGKLIAFKGSTPIEKFTDTIVFAMNFDPDHLYYYTDGKKIAYHELLEEVYEVDTYDEPAEALASICNTLGIKNLAGLFMLQGSLLKIDAYDSFFASMGNFLRKNFLLRLDDKVKLKDLVEFLGQKFTLVYDMGDMREVNLSLKEILLHKNFKKVYGDIKLPAELD